MSKSDTLPPPKKRQRRNSNGDRMTRSPYWFQDGNVVLQAENTLFRVHQSILSRHSQIFKDTFAMPQDPRQEDEHIEGCPVVLLADTAEDLSNIISLLYDHDMTLKFGSKLPARVLGSMLRLGRKYVIVHLEDEALDRLHHDYPTEFRKWDSCDDGQIQDSDRLEIKVVWEIISIAHEFRVFTILPAVYVQYLMLQSFEDILGDTSIPDEARQHCLIGNTRILAYVKDKAMDALCRPMVLPSKACSSGGKCQANRSNIKTLPIWKTLESESFGIFKRAALGIPKNLCSQCRTEVITFIDTVRSEFWSMLPTFFGLAAWADLKDGP